MDESNREFSKRFGLIWMRSRDTVGVSQEYMALELGVSKKTIQNWEKGISSPDLYQGFEWFRVLGLNPLSWYLEFLYPELYSKLDHIMTDEEVGNALAEYITNASPLEKRQILYLFNGKHGSDWFGLVQMMTAHCHTSMRSRAIAAQIILNNYQIEKETGHLVCPDEPLPDLDILTKSIELGMDCAKNNKHGYCVK